MSSRGTPRYHARRVRGRGRAHPRVRLRARGVERVSRRPSSSACDYPIAVDNGYKTWDAYQNNSWPAEYLIDATGQVRHAGVGEGDYGGTESLIRTLLVDAHPKVKLPPRTDVPDKTPTVAADAGVVSRLQVRLAELRRHHHHREPAGASTSSRARSPRRPGVLGDVDGGRREDHRRDRRPDRARLPGQRRVPGPRGHGHGQGHGGHHTPRPSRVSGIPRLYTLVSSSDIESATLVLDVSPGVDAYDFTFG